MANSAPNASIVGGPIGGDVLDFALPQLFSWLFSDPDAGDTQSAFDLQYRVVGAPTWTTVSGITSNGYCDFSAGTFSANNYEWQVRTYDAIGVVGPWTASSFFTAAASPASLAITAPASGATVAATATFTWTTPTQTDYQIRKVRDFGGVADTAIVYYDSGDVVDATTRSVTLSFPTNSRYEHLQIRIKDGTWSDWVSIRVLASYTQPSPGTLTVVADDVNASLVITTTAAAVGVGEPTPVSVDIYIKESGTAGYGDRIAVGRPPNGVFPWHTPAHGVLYEVRTLTTGDNGAQRWSSAVFTHIFDGGGAVPAAWTIALDGGNATTVFTNVVDGGTP